VVLQCPVSQNAPLAERYVEPQCPLISPHCHGTGRCRLDQAYGETPIKPPEPFILHNRPRRAHRPPILGYVFVNVLVPRWSLHLYPLAHQVQRKSCRLGRD